jgi:hypothetical protein
MLILSLSTHGVNRVLVDTGVGFDFGFFVLVCTEGLLWNSLRPSSDDQVGRQLILRCFGAEEETGQGCAGCGCDGRVVLGGACYDIHRRSTWRAGDAVAGKPSDHVSGPFVGSC